MNLQDLLEQVCVDTRIQDGIFSLEKDEHLDILQEYLQHQCGLSCEQTILLRNCIVEGKYPERQAYNVNGLLVTFPTPEYKQKAIARGTHFEENPKKAQQAASVNIFDKEPEPQAVPSEEKPDGQPDPVSTDVSTPTVQNEPIEKDQPEPDLEPDPEPDLRTPQEKQQDAEVVQKILTTEYSLEEAASNNFYNKHGTWYTSEGEIIGKSRYVENLGKIMVIKRK